MPPTLTLHTYHLPTPYGGYIINPSLQPTTQISPNAHKLCFPDTAPITPPESPLPPQISTVQPATHGCQQILKTPRDATTPTISLDLQPLKVMNSVLTHGPKTIRAQHATSQSPSETWDCRDFGHRGTLSLQTAHCSPGLWTPLPNLTTCS